MNFCASIITKKVPQIVRILEESLLSSTSQKFGFISLLRDIDEKLQQTTFQNQDEDSPTIKKKNLDKFLLQLKIIAISSATVTF